MNAPKGFESIDAAQLDHSPTRCNANVVKAALSLFHFLEKASTNPDGLSRLVAVERVLVAGPVMTRPETEVLFRAVGLRLADVPVAVSRFGL